MPLIPYTFGVDESSPMEHSFGHDFNNQFVFAPHFNLVDSEAYICFVPLVTTYCLHPDVPSLISPGGRHIFEMIHGHILAAAASNRCIIVFDASAEGDKFVAAIYDALHSWLAEHNISRSNIVVLTQNRNLGDDYNKYCGHGVAFCGFDFFVKKLLGIFSLQDAEFLKEMGFDRQSIRYRDSSEVADTFLSLNGTPRPVRILTVSGLQSKGMLHDTLWSMLGARAGKEDLSIVEAVNYRDSLGLNWISDEDIEKIISQTPKIIYQEESDFFDLKDANTLALKINHRLFERTFCSIVTETEFSDGEIERITEKTLKAIAMGHPSIIIGNPKSLKFIHELGFKTFAEVFDEEYDGIDPAGLRFASAFQTIVMVSELRRSGDSQKMAALREVCEHNISIAQGEALRNYERIVERPLIDALVGRLGLLRPGTKSSEREV